MTNEEMQRTMQFILEQHAQFVADMQQLKEAQALNEQRFAQNEQRFGQVAQLQTHLSNVMLELAEAQTRSEASIQSLAESQARTEGKLAETDERLNSLITVVERYISERRNGKDQS